MCSSIGLFPILHPPGYGISRLRNLLRRAGKRKIHTRIFLIASIFIVSKFICVVSSVSVFFSNTTFTQSDSIIDKNVRTSPILGTLWRVNFSKKSPHAMSGRAAFFDPDIVTIQLRS